MSYKYCILYSALVVDLNLEFKSHSSFVTKTWAKNIVSKTVHTPLL